MKRKTSINMFECWIRLDVNNEILKRLASGPESNDSKELIRELTRIDAVITDAGKGFQNKGWVLAEDRKHYKADAVINFAQVLAFHQFLCNEFIEFYADAPKVFKTALPSVKTLRDFLDYCEKTSNSDFK